MNSPLWDTYDHIEFDPRHRSRFLSDDKLVYGPPPASEVKMEDTDKPPTPEDGVFNGGDIPGQETRDNTDDYIGYLAYWAQKANEEGT